MALPAESETPILDTPVSVPARWLSLFVSRHLRASVPNVVIVSFRRHSVGSTIRRSGRQTVREGLQGSLRNPEHIGGGAEVAGKMAFAGSTPLISTSQSDAQPRSGELHDNR